MKSIFLLVFVASLIACNVTDKKQSTTGTTSETSSADNKMAEDSSNYTTLQWIDSVQQNLGTIKKGAVVEISWKFKNTGNKPLIVEDVRPACGCTVAEKPTEPIAPGAEGIIKAKYNSDNGSGTIHKEMTVLANNKNRNNGTDNKLSFSAEVKE